MGKWANGSVGGVSTANREMGEWVRGGSEYAPRLRGDEWGNERMGALGSRLGGQGKLGGSEYSEWGNERMTQT